MPLGACESEALGCDSVSIEASWMATPAMNLFGGFQDHLGSPNDDLLGQTAEGQQALIFAGADFALHGLSQEQKELFRLCSRHVEQEREAQVRIQAFEAAAASSASATPTHSGLLGQSQSLSPPPQSAQQRPSSHSSSFSHSSVSVPHTPLKPFDSSLPGIGSSALSTPTISTGSLSLAGAVMNASAVDAASSALHNSSPMAARQILGSTEHLLMVPSGSLLSVHAPAPGQTPPGQVPPPPPPSTPNSLLGVANGGPSGSVGSAGSGASGAGHGHLTMAFAQALAQAAAERGVDPATLVQLLQSPKLVDVLLSKAGDLQLQQQQQQQQPQVGQMSLQTPPPPPPPPKPPQLQSRMSAPVPGEWSMHHPAATLAGPAGLPHFRPPPPPPPRPSPAATAAAAAAAAAAANAFSVAAGSISGSGNASSGGASAASSGGGGASTSSSGGSGSGSLEHVPSMQQMLSSHLVQEFVSARGVLVQLMMSAYAFLNSDSMREFYDKLMPVSALYDEMHELPVVQKRKRCLEMSFLRMQLMQDPSFTQILQAVCALRHHLHSLSRKVLVMNQGPDGIPIDLLLGSMSTELFHLMKGVLPQEVCDFFGNCLPHPRLAVLVFAEFTSVDPMPTLA